MAKMAGADNRITLSVFPTPPLPPPGCGTCLIKDDDLHERRKRKRIARVLHAKDAEQEAVCDEKYGRVGNYSYSLHP